MLRLVRVSSSISMRRCECVWLKPAATADFISWARDITGLFLEIFFLRTYLPNSYFGIHILFYFKYERFYYCLMKELLFVCFRAEQESSGRILGRVNWREWHSQMGGSNHWAARYAIVSYLLILFSSLSALLCLHTWSITYNSSVV